MSEETQKHGYEIALENERRRLQYEANELIALYDGHNSLWRLKKIWNDEWKADMAGVDRCESCGRLENDGDPGSKLTQMHATKQRFITTRESCRQAAKVCWREHQFYDEGTGDDPHGKMAAFVDALIAKRPFDIDAKPEPIQIQLVRKPKRTTTMKEEIDGYRRTAVKTRDKQKLAQKIEEFEERGEEVMVKQSAGVYYLYVKKEKDLSVSV